MCAPRFKDLLELKDVARIILAIARYSLAIAAICAAANFVIRIDDVTSMGIWLAIRNSAVLLLGLSVFLMAVMSILVAIVFALTRDIGKS